MQYPSLVLGRDAGANNVEARLRAWLNPHSYSSLGDATDDLAQLEL